MWMVSDCSLFTLHTTKSNLPRFLVEAAWYLSEKVLTSMCFVQPSVSAANSSRRKVEDVDQRAHMIPLVMHPHLNSCIFHTTSFRLH